MYHTYILYSPSRDKYYIGQTSQIEQRLAQHQTGAVRATRHAPDWYPVFLCAFETRSQAMKLEYHLKKAKNRTTIQRYIDSETNECPR